MAGLLPMAPARSHASLSYYNTRSAFDAAEPGLPVQSFDSANLSGQPYATQPNGINSATNNGVFSTGSILPGLTLGTLNPGAQATALEVYSGGPVGTKSIGNNWFGDTLVLTFGPGVSAVAEDAFANASSGLSFAGTITEETFSGSTVLGSKTLTEAVGGSVFFGVSSSTLPITSVEITWGGDNDASTFVSNVAFGTAPEPSSFVGAAVFSLLALWFGPRKISNHVLPLRSRRA